MKSEEIQSKLRRVVGNWSLLGGSLEKTPGITFVGRILAIGLWVKGGYGQPMGNRRGLKKTFWAATLEKLSTRFWAPRKKVFMGLNHSWGAENTIYYIITYCIFGGVEKSGG